MALAVACNNAIYFSSLFQEVESNSLTVWKWEMYRLVDEFDQQPGLAPPFIIIEDIWIMLKMCFTRCSKERDDCTFIN